MSKIGIKTPSIYGLVTSMKRELLYFDQICIDTHVLEKDISMMRTYIGMAFSKADCTRFDENVKKIMVDIDYLIDKKAMVEDDFLQADSEATFPWDMAWPHIEKAEEFCNLYLDTSLAECGYPPPIGELRIPQKDNYEPGEIRVMEDYYLMILEMNRLITRLFSVGPGLHSHGANCVPIVDNITGSHEEEGHSRKEMVVGLTLEKMPVPSDSVSLEDILDFKSTVGAKSELTRLRKWVTNMVRSDLQRHEIEQEIDYLLSEYESEMRLNNLKYKYGTFEILIVTSAEILENTLKLRWSEAAKSLFSIKRRNVNLLAAEATSHGKEMAYLSRTGSAFDYQWRNSQR